MASLRITFVVLFVTISASLVAAPAFAGGGGHGRCNGGVTASAGEPAVELVGNCFQAAVLRVATGTTVTWTNSDAWAHAIDGLGPSFSGHDAVPAGASVTHVFAEPGVYPYNCPLHTGMLGAIVVEAADAVEADGGGTSTAVAADLLRRDVVPTGAEAVAAAGAVTTLAPDVAWLVVGLLVGSAAAGAASVAGRRR